ESSVTGVQTCALPISQQPRKQFELLKQVLPGLARVAILGDQDVPDAPSDPGWNPFERATDTAARTVGLQPQRLKVKGPTPDLDRSEEHTSELQSHLNL